MVPTVHHRCPYGPTQYRVAAASPAVPMPPNHVLLYCVCPCGAHRSHFTVHRNVLLHQMGRYPQQPITQNVRGQQPHLQRISEMLWQARLRRHTQQKDSDASQPDSDYEEGIDR